MNFATPYNALGKLVALFVMYEGEVGAVHSIPDES